MKTLTRIAVLALAVQATCSFGQSTTVNKDFDSPPQYQVDVPEKYSFEAYGNTPINYYNGSVNISLPLLDIPGSSLDMAVSASYTTHGVEINKPASEIGVDWSLRAGGSIVREMRGSSDFNPLRGDFQVEAYYTGWLSPSHIPIVKITPCNTLSDPNCGFRAPDLTYSIGNYGTKLDDIMLNKTYDTEPDVFHLNINGIQATFFYDYSKNLVIQSNQELEIQPPQADNGEWLIIDAYGNKYYFGEGPASTTGRDYTSWTRSKIKRTDSYHFKRWSATEWKIRRIETIDNEVIDYTYISQYTENIDQNHNYLGIICYDVSDLSSSSSHTDDFSALFGWDIHYSYKNYLTNVTYSRHQLEYSMNFIYSARPDNEAGTDGGAGSMGNRLYGYQRLDEVQLNSSHSGISQLVKKVKFSYHSIPGRLWLQSIKYFDNDNLEYQEYTFEYNNADKVPVQYSAAIDNFGYFNGQTSNTGFPPKKLLVNNHSYTSHIVMKDLSLSNEDFFTWNCPYDERETNPTLILYGHLSKIIYPTKGYTTFEYEPHTFNPRWHYSLGAGIRLKNVKDYKSDGILALSRELEYGGGKLTSVPFFQFESFTTSKPNGCSGSAPCVKPAIHTSGKPLIPSVKKAQGSLVGYDQVSLLFNGGVDGKIERTFVNEEVQTVYNSNHPREVECPVTQTVGYPDHTIAYIGGIPSPFSNYFGTLLSETIFKDQDNTFITVEKKDFQYIDLKRGTLNGDMYRAPVGSQYESIVMAFQELCHYVSSNENDDLWLMSEYHYEHDLTQKILETQTETKYMDDGSQYVSVTDYEYDTEHHLKIKSEAQNSDGLLYSTEYVYTKHLENSTDPQAAFASAMIADHKLAYPVAEIKRTGSTMHEGKVTLYDTEGNLTEVHDYTGQPGWYSFDKDDILDTDWEKRGSYEYDNDDRLINIHEEAGITTAVLENDIYTSRAMVVNAAEHQTLYNGFESPSGNYGLDHYSGAYSRSVAAGNPVWSPELRLDNPDQDRDYLFSVWIKTESGFTGGNILLEIIKDPGTANELILSSGISLNFTDTEGEWKMFQVSVNLNDAKNLNSIPLAQNVGIKAITVNNDPDHYYLLDECRLYPEGAEMTTYNFKPGFGVISVTDPRGEAQNYEYDASGKLQSVKDASGNILEYNQYHYKP